MKLQVAFSNNLADHIAHHPHKIFTVEQTQVIPNKDMRAKCLEPPPNNQAKYLQVTLF